MFTSCQPAQEQADSSGHITHFFAVLVMNTVDVWVTCTSKHGQSLMHCRNSPRLSRSSNLLVHKAPLEVLGWSIALLPSPDTCHATLLIISHMPQFPAWFRSRCTQPHPSLTSFSPLCMLIPSSRYTPPPPHTHTHIRSHDPHLSRVLGTRRAALLIASKTPPPAAWFSGRLPLPSSFSRPPLPVRSFCCRRSGA